MDVFSTFQKGKVTFSHLGIAWGLISDIDIESEKLRWLGELRMTLWAIIRLMFVREYYGALYYIPVSTEDDKSLEFQGNE